MKHLTRDFDRWIDRILFTRRPIFKIAKNRMAEMSHRGADLMKETRFESHFDQRGRPEVTQRSNMLTAGLGATTHDNMCWLVP